MCFWRKVLELLWESNKYFRFVGTYFDDKLYIILKNRGIIRVSKFDIQKKID